jgi:hypothetical protein
LKAQIAVAPAVAKTNFSGGNKMKDVDALIEDNAAKAATIAQQAEKIKALEQVIAHVFTELKIAADNNHANYCDDIVRELREAHNDRTND